MKTEDNKIGAKQWQTWMAGLLRIAIGWHFLYEGIVKLMNPAWSASTYLKNARWIFSSFFHWMANNDGVLNVIDFLNIWGLVFIGIALLLGILTKTAYAAGILLLTLYYITNPSLIDPVFNSVSSEGSYMIVNKNIIEILALALLCVTPNHNFVGLEGFIKLFRLRNQKKLYSEKTNTKNNLNGKDLPGSDTQLRRSFVKSLGFLPFAGFFGIALWKKSNAYDIDSATGPTTIEIPKNEKLNEKQKELFYGNIKDIRISRLMMDDSTIGAWPHARDLHYIKRLYMEYNTKERIMKTLSMAAQAGINTIDVHSSLLETVQEHNEKYHGHLQMMVSVAINSDEPYKDIERAKTIGAKIIYLQPYITDRLVKQNRTHLLKKSIAYIQHLGIPAGIGCFSVESVLFCEENQVDPDFYIKTIHPDSYWSATPFENRKEFEIVYHKLSKNHNEFHDNIFDLYPKKTIQVMKSIGKPWIAKKVTAAGAIKPEEALPYAFSHGADFISIGLFDFNLIEHRDIALKSIEGSLQRTRPWKG